MPKRFFPLLLTLFIVALAACDSSLPRRSTTAAATVQVSDDGRLTPDLRFQGNTEADPAEWTVLVYMDADEQFEAAAIADINEMEQHAGAPGLNIAVQIGRSTGMAIDLGGADEARRYQLRQDGNPNVIRAALAENLGRIDMASEASLADFVRWGVSTYPAQRYALVLWGRGGGWRGLLGDSHGEAAPLSMAQLQRAIGNGLTDSELDRFQILALDAALAADIHALAPLTSVADVLVASPSVTAMGSWPYDHLVDLWGQMSTEDGRAVAIGMANTIAQANPTLPIAALDSQRLPNVLEATDALAALIAAETDAHLNTLTNALAHSRTNHTNLPNLVGAEVATVNLYRFAQALVQHSPDAAVIDAAQTVLEALDAGLIASTGALAGPNVYFPANVYHYDGQFGQLADVATWNEMLIRIHASVSPDPTLSLLDAESTVANPQTPLALGFEAAGIDLVEIVQVVGQQDADGLQLVDYRVLHPADGNVWTDGVVRDTAIWTTEAPFVAGAASGSHTVAWPLATAASDWGITGRWIPINGRSSHEVAVLFDDATGLSNAVWGVGDGRPYSLTVAAGDRLQLDQYRIDGRGRLLTSAGESVTFDADGRLRLSSRPLAAGSYATGFYVVTRAGRTAVAVDEQTVSAPSTVNAPVAFLDTAFPFQFDYPNSWIRPQSDGSGKRLLYTSSEDGSTNFQLRIYPATSQSAAALQSAVFEEWAVAEAVFQDAVPVAGVIGERTFYQYFDEAGLVRRGVLLSFVANGDGYVIDVDGSFEREPQTVAAAELIKNSWQFVGASASAEGGRWTPLLDGSAELNVPLGFDYTTLDNGWQYLISQTEARTFIGRQLVPESDRSSDEAAAFWLDVAQDGATDFQTLESSWLDFEGQRWERLDFRYEAGGRTIRGLLLTSVGDAEQVLWAEAPEEGFSALAQTALLALAEFNP